MQLHVFVRGQHLVEAGILKHDAEGAADEERLTRRIVSGDAQPPRVGARTVVSILIVVVFPAPLGPRKPKMTPASTANEMWSTAVKPSKRLTRSRASMIAAVILPTIPLGRACPCDPLRCGLYGHPEPT